MKLKATIEFRDEEVKRQKQEIYQLRNQNAMTRRQLDEAKKTAKNIANANAQANNRPQVPA